jgi:CheY-like chemotaxis protein
MPERSILLVEDNIALRETLAQVLRDERFHVVTAGNGIEALRHLRNGHSFGVVLLDLVMPEMDGWEFRRVQREDARIAAIPVIAMSASGPGAIKHRPIDADEFLPKPVDLDHLIETIRRVIST